MGSLPVSILLAVLASETFVSTKAAIPPGYEDDMWCPEGFCDQPKEQGEDFVGPESSFHQCYDTASKQVVEAVWTGFLSDVVAPTGWGKNPESCPEKKEKCEDSVRSGKKLGVILPETGKKEKYTCGLIKEYNLCKNELTSKKNKGYLAESICKESCGTCSKKDTMKPTMTKSSKKGTMKPTMKKKKKRKKNIPEGFEIGMATELAGMWVGTELYMEGNVTYPYCTNAAFMASTLSDSNYLYWYSVAQKDDTIQGDPCEVLGVDPLTGSVNNPSYYGMSSTGDPWEPYLLDVKMRTCSSPAEDQCTYDVTTNEKFKDFEVVATACGAHLKEYLLQQEYGSYRNVCELYQISRIEKCGADDTCELHDVAVLTYGHTFEGYNNYRCAKRPTFDVEELEADPDAVGSTLLVRQVGFAPTPAPMVRDWECTHFDDTSESQDGSD